MNSKDRNTFWVWIGFLVIVIFSTQTLFGAMSKSKAYTEAHKIWGDWSRIEQGINWGETFDTYKIGFTSAGCAVPFTIVGVGVGSWDAAFSALPADKGIFATVKATYVVSASAYPHGTIPPPTGMVVVDIPGKTVAVQFLLDGKPLEAEVPVTSDPPWSVQINWDTSISSNGLHYICSQAIHADGSYQFTPAGMVLVQNP